MSFNDTVAALSTPYGKGGIAVVRISGADTAQVLSRVFRPVGTDPVTAPRRACFGRIVAADGSVVDEGLAVFFAAPASFTGEDVAEISCHGGILVSECVLAAVLSAGARMAEAGEFTRRAMLMGKMGLSSAEALGALLDAKTAGQLSLARGGMSGRLADRCREEYAILSEILADVYAKIDFPDEDLNSMSREQLRDAFAAARARLTALGDTYRTGHAVAEGIRTVICGPVNAGKSTLYNRLVGKDAAIVTDVAGTTRDVLTTTVSLGKLTLLLSDTAGLRESDDPVERIGVDRSREEIASAELILAVLDSSRPWGEEEHSLLAMLKDTAAPVVLLLNKQDIEGPDHAAEVANFDHVLPLFAKNGDLAALVSLCERLFAAGEIDLSADAIVANARQHAALTTAAAALGRALDALDVGLPLDACCIDGEAAMQSLGEVDGRAVNEQIISDVFSHFCVGK